MDFFEAQSRARRRSGRLLVLFALAVLGTIAAVYAAAIGILSFQATAADFAPWQPRVLLPVTLGTLALVGGASLYQWARLRSGGPAVAEMLGGRPVSPSTPDLRERTYLNIVEEMALASGLPVPATYVLPDESAINAFAAGYSPADAAIAVTSGALERLDRDELQGVVAHEFSHILYGDMRLNTRLSALIFGLLALSVLGRLLLQSASRTRYRSSSRSGKNSGGGLALLFASGLALLLIGWIGHLFGKLIQAAVSRQREFLADAAAVQFTRHPAGLAGALKKLGGSTQLGRLDAPRASEISHFCFAQNFPPAFTGLFATHPPLADRIRAIDPAFDGTYTPPTRLSNIPARAPLPPPPPRAAAPFAPASQLSSAGSSLQAPASPRQPPAPRIDAAALVADAGRPTPATLAAGQAFLASLPDSLRVAAHDPRQVSALCYALCLPRAADPATLATLLALVAERADPAAARLAADLHATLVPLPPTLRLPLLQLSTPVLRHLDPAACATLLDTLATLVHADGIVTPHEYALQKILSRTLGLSARPRDALHVFAPAQVIDELSLALSVAARLDHPAPGLAEQAFARAAAAFTGLQPPLAYAARTATTLDQLDQAIDRLALTPAPFRKRILAAFATALTADGTLSPPEAELLRALAASLDCPLPPILPA